jgi:YHS domain-containing protein
VERAVRAGFDSLGDEKEVRRMAKDPVCGMNVEEKKAAATAVHDGKTYYFCSVSCKATFEKAPAKYAER